MRARYRLHPIGALVVLLACIVQLPSAVLAQDGLRVSVSPLVGVGEFPDLYHRAPNQANGNLSIGIDAATAIGAQVEVASAGFPLRLRVGGMRTVGGSLQSWVGSPGAGCGDGCGDGAGAYGSAGDAAVTLVWTDVVIAPFSWRLSPYLHGGATYRRASFSAESATIQSYLGSGEARTMGRYGFGAEFALFGGAVVSMDFSRHVAGNEDEGYEYDGYEGYSSGWTPVARQDLATMGVKLRVF